MDRSVWRFCRKWRLKSEKMVKNAVGSYQSTISTVY